MSEKLSQALPSSLKSAPRQMFNPRSLGFASLILSLAACSGTQHDQQERGLPPFYTTQTGVPEPEAGPPPLTEAEILAEREACKNLYIYANSLREDKIMRTWLLKRLEKSAGQERAYLEDRAFQCQMRLELAGFAAFRCIQSASPRCWPRLVTALQAIIDLRNRVPSAESFTIELYGELAGAVDAPEVMDLLRPMYREQIQFLAIAIGRMDLSIQILERRAKKASKTEQAELELQITGLRARRKALLDPISNGELLPSTPAVPTFLREELMEHFIKFRHARGGLPRDHHTQPRRIGFGRGTMPPLQLNIMSPSTPLKGTPQRSPSGNGAPGGSGQQPKPDVAPEPKKEKPERPPKPDYRPRNASFEAPEGLETQVVLMMGLLHASQMHRLG